MNKNNNNQSDSLRDLAIDLDEVYGLMNELCSQLQGGGIVQARDIEPSVARAVPKLRHAITTLAKAAESGASGELKGPAKSPLLM